MATTLEETTQAFYDALNAVLGGDAAPSSLAARGAGRSI